MIVAQNYVCALYLPIVHSVCLFWKKIQTMVKFDKISLFWS